MPLFFVLGKTGVTASLHFKSIDPPVYTFLKKTHSGIHVLELFSKTSTESIPPDILSLFHDDCLSTIISSSLLNADVYTLLSMSDNQSVLQVLTHCVEVCCV